MDDGSPTLEVGFAIDHADSFGSLNTLDDLIGETAANAVREFQRMENASRSSVSLAGATAEVKTFGAAATRELQAVARETARVEKAGDALSRQLDRQISTFGMSRAASQALRSERAGLAEQAERLRSQEASLAQLNTEAAIRQQAIATRERIAAEQALNSQLAERAKLQAAIERGTGAGRTSAMDAGATFSALAARAAEEEARAVREAAAAHQMFEARVRQGVVAMREQAAATAIDVRAKEQLAAAAERLRASIDPSAAAQQRFNREMAEARTLVSAGVISLDEYVAKLRMEQAALDDTRDVMARHTSGAVANRMAMQGASYQVQDFWTQVSMGANPINAFAVQGAQLAGQFSHVEGKAGDVARFFMGPWGLAITAGLMVLGPLIGKLLEGNNAFDDAVDKLKKDAAATETNRLAQAAFAQTLEGVIDAMKRRNEEFEKSIRTQRDMAVQSAADARVEQATALRKTADLKAQLDAAKSAAQVARDIAGMPGADPASSAMSIARAEGEVVRLSGALKVAEASAAGFARGIREADSALALASAKTATDKIGSINAAFDQQVADATRAAVATAKSQQDITVALTKQLTQIEINRQAALKAEQDKQKAGNETARQIGRNIDIAEARRIAQSVGGTVTSDLRSRAKQEELYAKYQAYKNGTGPWAALAAKPGTSNHEMGQAIDVAKTRGMTLAKLIDAFKASGVQVKEALDEGSHFHIAWGKVGAAAREQTEAQREAARAIAEKKREEEAAIKAATDYAAAQQQVTEQTGMSAKEIRAYADEIAIAKAPTEALKQAIRDAAVARETAFSKQSATEFQTNVMKPLQDELALYGLVGPARAKAALELEKEAFMARNVGDGVEVATKRWQDYYNAKMALAEKDDTAQREVDAIARINGELDEMIGRLGSMGKLGGALGGLLGIFSGRTGAVGGPLGDLLNLSVKNDKGIAVSLGEQLSKVFDKGGPFAKTMSGLLQGSGTGMLAGGIFGQQSGSEKLGSAIGGAIGGKVGEEFLSKGLESVAKGLGDFAGPLGSIAGGIIGNLLGGLLSSAKWGRVNLTSGGVSDATGNSSSMKKASLAAGNSIFGSLQGIAEQFGGSIGNFGSITVGQRNGDWRVNAGGTSLKVKKGAADFGEDAEAAALYAMQLAIERGAITGIRAGTNALLKSGDDLQAALKKALAFEGVFIDLKASTDPVGAELATLGKEFDALRKIFAEAGATAAEYAELEQLLALRREEVLNKERDAINDVRIRIARAQGDDATAKQIERAQELRDAMTDAVRAELLRWYAVEDSIEQQQRLAEEQREAAAAAQELRDAWKSVGDSITDEIKRIRGIAEANTPGGFASLLGQFNAASSAARGGDIEAAKSLPELSQALLAAAAAVATSRQELDRIRAQTAASLETTNGLVASLAGTATATTTAAILDAGATNQSAAASSNDNGSTSLAAQLDALRQEMAQMRTENTAGHAATAANTGKAARILENVTPSGDAITVEAAA